MKSSSSTLFSRYMVEKILNKTLLTEANKKAFEKLGNNFYITDKLFYKDDLLYSLKIIYKNSKITYQLKKTKKIILKTLQNKIIKILKI